VDEGWRIALTEELLLVDFENVQQVDLSHVDAATRVVIFHGASQKSVPIDLVSATQSLGKQVEWVKIEGNGKNALDFHIACYLGRILEKEPGSICVVLSKDKGFDPLLKYLNRHGLTCRRIESMLERVSAPIGAVSPHYKRVLEVLRKSEKKSRPRKRKTLAQHIASIFQKKLSAVEVEGVIDLLFANKQISEENGAITYSF